MKTKRQRKDELIDTFSKQKEFYRKIYEDKVFELWAKYQNKIEEIDKEED